MRSPLIGLNIFGLGLLAAFGCDGSTASEPCAQYGEVGCVCRDEPREGDVAFQGTCSAAGMGTRAICCRGSDYCKCMPVQCGISSISGNCLCGVDVFLESLVASCTGTAATCCTQDTGYCYCEDGCESRFANYLVDTCDLSTSTATCSSDELPVSNCQ